MSRHPRTPRPESANHENGQSDKEFRAHQGGQISHRNPFWTLVVITGFAFAATCLTAVVGELRPQSPLNRIFDRTGSGLFIVEAGCLVLFGLSAMTLDRLQTLRMLRSRKHSPGESNEELN